LTDYTYRLMFYAGVYYVVGVRDCVLRQGTTMQPLVKALRVKTQQKIEITMSHTIGERVRGSFMTELKLRLNKTN